MTRREQVEALLDDGEATVGKMMAAFSLDAVDDAARRGFDLDYSVGSLQQVEEILDALHRSRPRGFAKFLSKGPSEADIQTVAKLYGGYIGEVMRIEGGGDWLIPQDGPFTQALTLQRGETACSPPAKVYKRLSNGTEDNVAYYYQVMMRDHNGDTA